VQQVQNIHSLSMCEQMGYSIQSMLFLDSVCLVLLSQLSFKTFDTGEPAAVWILLV